MTRRYGFRNMLWTFDDRDCGPPMSMDYVEEKLPERQETGLLDAEGRKLYRIEAKEPVGFRLRELPK